MTEQQNYQLTETTDQRNYQTTEATEQRPPKLPTNEIAKDRNNLKLSRITLNGKRERHNKKLLGHQATHIWSEALPCQVPQHEKYRVLLVLQGQWA